VSPRQRVDGWLRSGAFLPEQECAVQALLVELDSAQANLEVHGRLTDGLREKIKDQSALVSYWHGLYLRSTQRRPWWRRLLGMS